MSITQEAANLIDTLAHAASQIGSTAASAKINQLIVSILPATDGSAEEIAEALRQDNAALQLELAGTQKSVGIMAENLTLLRDRMEQINTIAYKLIQSAPADDDGEKIEQIINLSAPATDPVEA
jgi:hypothetical protein